MTKKTQYVIPLGRGWAVKSGETAKFAIITDKKSDAVSYAKAIAKRTGGKLVIYGKDGKIISHNSYANDSIIVKN